MFSEVCSFLLDMSLSIGYNLCLVPALLRRSGCLNHPCKAWINNERTEQQCYFKQSALLLSFNIYVHSSPLLILLMHICISQSFSMERHHKSSMNVCALNIGEQGESISLIKDKYVLGSHAVITCLSEAILLLLLVSLIWKICLLTRLRKCTETIKRHTTEMFIDVCAKFGDMLWGIFRTWATAQIKKCKQFLFKLLPILEYSLNTGVLTFTVWAIT